MDTGTPATVDTPKLLAGRYRLGEVLGRGGMGTVWQATDERLHRQVAIKQVQAPPGLPDAERRTLAERTLREARAAAAISSPAAVTVFDVVDDGDMPWIIMELLHARPLSSVIAERGTLAVADVVRIGLALLDALEAAHAAGVLHRDVKPSNVMVDDHGAVVLTDFGIATLEGDSSLTTSGALIGSPAYLAPERARGEAASPASDLWSLGATLYTAVEGRAPFHREGQLATLAAVMTDDPAPALSAGALAPLLTALLSKDPAARPRPAELRVRLLAALDASSGDEGAAVRPAVEPVDVGALSAAQRTEVVPVRVAAASRRRPPAWRTLAAVAAVLVAAVLVAGLAVLRPGDPAGEGSAAAADGATSAPPAASQAAPTGEPALSQPATTPPPAPEVSEPTPTPPSPTGPAAVTATAAPPAVGAAPAAVPAGYRSYTDPAGWSVAVPEGWQEVRDGPRIDFRSGDGAFLRIDSTDTPADDPVEDWTDQEGAVSRRLAGYQRISIEPVDYRGWDAADWRFSFDGTRARIQVLNRGFVVAADEAHALYYSAPEGSYDESVHEVAAATFTPQPR